MTSVLKVRLLRKDAKIPSKASEGSAGFDLYATEEVIVPSSRMTSGGRLEMGQAVVSTGIAVELPQGTVGRLASRSGLSVRFGIEVAAGWIDSDYRGELLIVLMNFGPEDYRVRAGDRVAQLVVLNVGADTAVIVDELGVTKRGFGGLGSTGR